MKIKQLYIEKIYIWILLSAIAVTGCTKSNTFNKLDAADKFPPMANSEEWQVIRVSDGDTIVIRQADGQEKKLRFCGIDAPEKSQPLGKESKANLQRLVDEVDGTVSVSEIESDRYGRTVAEVFSSKNGVEKNFNSEQVLVGLAIVYPAYVKKCPNGDVFLKAEAIAQSKHIGMWSGNYQKPWDYRKQQRSK